MVRMVWAKDRSEGTRMSLFRFYFEIRDLKHKEQPSVRTVVVTAISEDEALRKVKRLKPKLLKYIDSGRIVRNRDLVEDCFRVEEV